MWKHCSKPDNEKLPLVSGKITLTHTTLENYIILAPNQLQYFSMERMSNVRLYIHEYVLRTCVWCVM